jgi:hypothetical protein
MYNFSAIKILKTFTADEVKEFDKFIKSPFFGGTKYIADFFKIIKKHHPGFDSKSLEKTKVFAKLYPGKKYDDSLLRKLSSELLKMLEKYITFKGSEYYPGLENKFYLTYTREKRLDNLFESKWEEASKEFDNRLSFNFDNLLFQHFNQIEIINYNVVTNQNHLNGAEYIKFAEYILNYAIIILCQSAANNKINTDAFNTGFDESGIEDFISSFGFEKYISLLKKRDAHDHPAVELNYFLMMMYRDHSSDEYFKNYKRILYENFSGLNKYLKYNLFNFLIHNAYYKVQLGKLNYNKELISVFDKMAELGIIVDPYRRYISNNHIRLAAIASIASHKYGWIDNFMYENLHRLDPANRQNIITFVNALTAFEKNEYEKSLELLNEVEFELIALKFDVKELLLKIYYELNYLDTAASALDAFKSFINKNKFSSEIRKKNLLLFVKYYGRLLRIKMKGSYDDIAVLRKEIADIYFTGKNWMEEKIMQIEKAA